MENRIEVVCADGEIVGCYIGDRLTHELSGNTGIVIGVNDNKVRLRLDGRADEIEISAENLLQHWE